MGVSGAYAARRRNPLFAAAWDGALTIARDRLADTLLARSMEGNVEQIWRDGVLVGERHVLDNALGLAIPRRLDRIAETGRSASTRGEPAHVLQRSGERLPKVSDWPSAVAALRSGDDEGVAQALALIAPGEVEEVEGPPNSAVEDHSKGLDLSDRCWRDSFENVWMTDFPPPAGFDGFETRDFHNIANPEPYQRACTPEEAAVLDSDAHRRGPPSKRRRNYCGIAGSIICAASWSPPAPRLRVRPRIRPRLCTCSPLVPTEQIGYLSIFTRRGSAAID